MLRTPRTSCPRAPAPFPAGSPLGAAPRPTALPAARRAARVPAAALAAALALAACSTPHAPAAAPGQTTTATAAASLSPQDRALRDAALAAPKPQRPAEADQHDMAGAVAAAEYFTTLYPYVYATGDLTDFRAMSATTCKFCNTVITKVTDMHAAGGWIDPWEHHITFTSISDDPANPDRHVVELHVVSDEHVSHRTGEPPQTDEEDQLPVLVQLLWQDGTGWMIEEVALK